MVTTPSKPISLDEFLALPETKPASEYIDGKIIQKPMPQGEHSTIQGELIIVLNGALKSQKIARAFPELRCTFGGRSIVPDVAVYAWDRIPRQDNGRIANAFKIEPDWTIEILSPDQRHSRVTKNILHCLNHGTQLGWLIDPQEQSVFVYFQGQQPAFFEDAKDILPVPDFAKAFELTIGELFGWLLE
ncbi:Uma2 family endonuclease [Myxosarcina sp. GI1]|uniref:Uma2 family endonuclease n=1 Tax=Myxosarcina sp. GI1 TaxID=1541065 RepID=UPI00056C3556|nr:Uma2 family endonuclease [Myxosarcina sp. GI1]